MQQQKSTENLVQEFVNQEITTTGIESRKRFYEETNQESIVKHQPKRCLLSSIVDFFKPKQTKIGEISIAVEENKKEETVKLTIETKDKQSGKLQKETKRVITMNKDSDIEQKMKGVSYEVTQYLVDMLECDKNSMIQYQLQALDSARLFKKKLEESPDVVDGLINNENEVNNNQKNDENEKNEMNNQNNENEQNKEVQE